MTTTIGVVTFHWTSRLAAAASTALTSLPGAAPELGDESADELPAVHDGADPSRAEDRRVGVRVHRDDGLRAADASEVLAGAGDAEGEVDVGAHRLPRQADLPPRRRPAGVPRRGRPPPRPAARAATSPPCSAAGSRITRAPSSRASSASAATEPPLPDAAWSP